MKVRRAITNRRSSGNNTVQSHQHRLRMRKRHGNVASELSALVACSIQKLQKKMPKTGVNDWWKLLSSVELPADLPYT